MLRANQTKSTKLGVNAAFLREIKQDHRELHRLLDESLTIFSLESFRTHRTSEVLEALRDRVATHFELEESFGYFAEAIEDQPWLESEVDELRTEHDTLTLWLDRLIHLSEGVMNRMEVGKMRGEFHAFLGAFRQHESAENDLILRAFNEEIGVGD